MGKRLRVLLAAVLVTAGIGAGTAPGKAEDAAYIEQAYVNLPQVTVYGTGLEDGAAEAYLGDRKLEVTGTEPFSQTGEPIYYYVLLDISNSMPEKYFNGIKQSIQNFEGTLGENDRMILYTFGEEVELKLDEGHNPADTQAVLESIGNTDNKTLLFEAVSQAADRAEQVLPETCKRRVLAVISDGEDFTVGKTGAQEAQENLMRKGIPAYAFGIEDTARENINNFGTFARASGGQMTVFGADQAAAVLDGFHQKLESYDTVVFDAGSNVVSNRLEAFTLKTAANQTLSRDVMVSRYIPDQAAPVILRVEKVADDQAEVEFSEPVKGAEAASAYTVSWEENTGKKKKDKDKGKEDDGKDDKKDQDGDNGNGGENTKAGESVNSGENTEPGGSSNSGESSNGENTESGENSNGGENTKAGESNNGGNGGGDSNMSGESSSAAKSDNADDGNGENDSKDGDSSKDDEKGGNDKDKGDKDEDGPNGKKIAAVASVSVLKDKENTVLLTFTSDLKPGTYTVSCTGVTDLSMEGHAVMNSMDFEVEQPPLGRRILEAVRNWYWIFLILAAAALIFVVSYIYRKVKKGRGVVYVDGKPVIASEVEVHKHVAIQEEEGMPFHVRVNVKGNKPEDLDLTIVDSFIVGRSKICNLYFDDKKMSRQHFALEWDGQDMYVTDLDTTNGTFLNGVKINKRRQLKQGDTISAGSVELTVRW